MFCFSSLNSQSVDFAIIGFASATIRFCCPLIYHDWHDNCNGAPSRRDPDRQEACEWMYACAPCGLLTYGIRSILTTSATGKNLAILSGLLDFLTANSINGGVELAAHVLSPYPANPPPQGEHIYLNRYYASWYHLLGPADRTIRLDIDRPAEMKWTLNNVPWDAHGDYTTPLLFEPSQLPHLDNRTHFSYPYGSLVDILAVVTAGNPAIHPPHPLREFTIFGYLVYHWLILGNVDKHGNKAWFLVCGLNLVWARHFTPCSMCRARVWGTFRTSLSMRPFRPTLAVSTWLTLLIVGRYFYIAFPYWLVRCLQPGDDFVTVSGWVRCIFEVPCWFGSCL